MNIIFEIHGGLGKSIAATVVCSKIKQKYPGSKLIVITHWKDVFLNNPYVDICISGGEDAEFYEKYVQNQEVLFMLIDPYMTSDYVKGSKHIIQCWLDLIGEQYNNELPELYFTTQEKQYYSQSFKTSKPMMLIHPNGGSVKNKLDKYNWARDIPPNVVQAVIDAHKDEYTVGIIRTEDQIKYNNCIDLVEKWRMVAIGMIHSKKRLLIDSSFQHIAAALGLKSTVLWSVTKPEVFGYCLHDNISANPYNKPQKSTSAYTGFTFVEPLQNMPYESFSNVFNNDVIFQSLKNQV